MHSPKNELQVQIAIGVFLVLLGIVLNLVPANGGTDHTGDKEEPGASSNAPHSSFIIIVHHIGTAILTAGMLMMTVELYAKYREARSQARVRQEQEKYINQLRDAQSDALLRGLLPDKAIFEQIKSEILQ